MAAASPSLLLLASLTACSSSSSRFSIRAHLSSPRSSPLRPLLLHSPLSSPSSPPRRPLFPIKLHPDLLSATRDSLFVLVASLALSVSVFVSDVGSAAAFVVTTPRKLQSDELATVRLFQENTPSVVYITNLAVRQDAFTLDVLEVPQGSGSGFVWDKDGHIVTNYHVIRGASDLSC